jgi:hypothetical protein
VINRQILPAKIVSSSLADGQTVSGLQHWLVQVSGTVKNVEFLVDGSVRTAVTKSPFAYDWDTTSETTGPHTVAVRATGVDGTVVEQTSTVQVSPPTAR